MWFYNGSKIQGILEKNGSVLERGGAAPSERKRSTQNMGFRERSVSISEMD